MFFSTTIFFYSDSWVSTRFPENLSNMKKVFETKPHVHPKDASWSSSIALSSAGRPRSKPYACSDG